ncbi:MAG TPA: sulfotransferase, partial [Sphingomicrobium sp.]
RVAIAGAAPEAQADLGFALAGLLDSAGRHEEAFAAAAEANAASKAATRADYDRAGHERLIERLIGIFSAPATGAGEPPAIFICGLFRSGSTLVEQILGAHSRVAAGGELDLIPALVERIPGYPEAVADAASATIREWRDFYLSGLPASGGRLMTDKRPDNFLHIGFIKTLFPAAKIVHTRRNRLDNLLSLYFLHLDPGMAYALDLADAAHWHGQYERLMAHWKSLYPNDIFDVDYDGLVRSPEPAIKALLAFLGLDWENSLLDFHCRQTTVRTASVWQVRQPLHARSSGRWKNYEKWLEPSAGLEPR